MKRHCSNAAVLMTLSIAIACGGDGISSTIPTPRPPRIPTLSGTVNVGSGFDYVVADVNQAGPGAAANGDPIAGAIITILDGPNSGRSTATASNGTYRFDNLTAGDMNVSATAAGYQESRGGVFVNGAAFLLFALTPIAQP